MRRLADAQHQPINPAVMQDFYFWEAMKKGMLINVHFI